MILITLTLLIPVLAAYYIVVIMELLMYDGYGKPTFTKKTLLRAIIPFQYWVVLTIRAYRNLN